MTDSYSLSLSCLQFDQPCKLWNDAILAFLLDCSIHHCQSAVMSKVQGVHVLETNVNDSYMDS